MQTNWMRYVWILTALFVFAAIAVLLSMNIPRAGTASPALVQAQQAFDSNDLDGALNASESALASNPNDIAALLAKATTLAQKGSLEFKETQYGEQAIAVAQQVLALDPQNADAWRIIGYANEIMQQYQEAHDAYTQAMTLDPSNAAVVSQDAHAWDLQGDMEQADTGYRKALALNPSLEQANAGLARVLIYQNRMNEALPLYEYLMTSSQNARVKSEAAYSAGQIQALKGQLSEAEVNFRLSTTYDSSYALGWTGLSINLFQQMAAKESDLSVENKIALMDESIADVQKAIALNPDQSLAHYQYGILLIAMDRRSDALIVLKGLQKQIIDADITLSAPAKAVMHKQVQAAIVGLSDKIAQ